jgi:hypothetical protein
VLSRHFGIPSKDVIIAADKSDVGGDMLVDDRHEHVNAWTQAHPGKVGVLIDAPYNRNAVLSERCYRVASVTALDAFINERTLG